ncbi:unnamed protein product [Allacma fusca]|uniref:mannosyl-oligosaccharide 1,2-alpha-mannosidase n=1 Tax=Allacma fusca TaxID=39272 RepID=A0A8J2KGK0_9HEXA|nr:unnamed protein product [Allacma fusca]
MTGIKLFALKKRPKIVIAIVATVVLVSFSIGPFLRSLHENFHPQHVLSGLTPDPDSYQDIQSKRDFIKMMMKDSWDNYVRFAWGANELKPFSQTWQNGHIFGSRSIGATIIDALDTLHIMGMTDEYKKARNWVEKSFDLSRISWVPWGQMASLFEINIRIIGGLLSAYALTGDTLFAEKAYEVGKMILPAFDTPSGIPYNKINPTTGVIYESKIVSLAALGTFHLEFVYLSEITGDPVFAKKVSKIRENMKRVKKPRGLYPKKVSIKTGQFKSESVTIGSGSDSFYEYLLKSWIQTQDTEARKMYDEAMDALIENLMFTSKPSHLVYFGDSWGTTFVDHTFSHLACFAGGMFALGSFTEPTSGAKRKRDMKIGENITYTCRQSYVRSKTGIGPENFYFNDQVEAMGINPEDKVYLLRPEVIESYFLLYRLTKDPKYRQWGWEAALAIQKYCSAGAGRGYSGITDVYAENPEQDDVQQTFFLAETLKYLYLLFSESDVINLNNWVFNTEGHPLPIKGKNAMFSNYNTSIREMFVQ